MKKLLLAILTLALLVSTFGLVACGENEQPHTHVYDKQVVSDTFKASDATCENKAKYYYSCSCGEKGTTTFEYGELDEHKPGTEATETTDQKCTVCEQIITPALGHVHTLHLTKVDAKTQSCTEEGNVEYYICSCEKWFTDNTATTEITDKTSVVIAKDKHEYKTLKNNEIVHWYECICGDKSGIEEHKPGIETTETTDQKCTVCEQIITPALGHVHTLHLTKVDAKTQSCTEEGNIEYYICSCEKWFTDNTATTEITDKTSVVIAKDKHEYKTLKNNETEHWYECICGDKSSIEEHKGGTATCTNLAECSVCYVEYGVFAPCKYENNKCIWCGQGFSEGLDYNLINNDTEYEVVGIGACNDIDIIIPSIYNGKPVTSIGGVFADCDSLQEIIIPDSVTSIGDGAFNDCDSLESVVIGNSVTSIGDGAFYDCGSLKEIIIPDSVISIDEYAFYGCSSLESVVIGNSVTSIGRGAFYDCDSLKEIIIPDSVTSIGWEAFYGCSSLKSVVIGNSVTSIGGSAFRGCNSLTSVEIPNSVTSIYWGAFWSCDSLQEIIIPDSVTSIDYSAFEACDSLESITVSEDNQNYKSIDGNLYSKDGKTLIQYAIGKTATAFTIPNSVTSIVYSAFSRCNSLEEIIIPDSVISIGNSVFEYCGSLKEIIIPDSVTSMGHSAFSRCNSLESVTIGNSVTSIGDYAFSRCNSLESVTIGNSVTSIGDYAFTNCGSLKEIIIPDSVTSIRVAFEGCRSLTSIEVGENNLNYKSIDGNLYSKDGKTLIKYAIGKTATAFTIPDSVTSIGYDAFEDCDSLQEIIIPDSVTSIGGKAFEDCDSLQEIIIPDSVTSIGNSAFYDCNSLVSVTFKNPNGWKADNRKLSASDLSNVSTAAKYLKDTYSDVPWTRS